MELSIAGILTLLGRVILGMGAFLLMLWVPLKVLGISLKGALYEITLPEAIFFGLYAVACALVVGNVSSVFV